MTIMPASDSSEKQASSRAGKRGTANAPYKPLKMTATHKRRALKKKIRRQEPARVSQLCFRLRIEKQVCRTNAFQNHSHRSTVRHRNREGRCEHTHVEPHT